MGKDEAGSDGVGKRRHGHLFNLEHHPNREHAERHRAPNTEAAVGDFQGIGRVTVGTEILLVIRNHVIQAPADDARRDDNDGCIPHDIGIAATRNVAALRHPHRHQNADNDTKCVSTQRKRT